MKKKINQILIILMGVSLMFLFGCFSNKDVDTPEDVTEASNGEITKVHFTYDNFSGNQFYLDVIVDKISEKGAKAEISKRVGPNNYTGSKKEGTIKLDADEVEELLDILGRYDLEAFTNYQAYGVSYSPSRTLCVFSGKNMIYDVRFNTQFPKTLPPEEDIMYAELYNFFNDLVAKEPGWEEVVNDNLKDPRDNPAYYDRTVTWFGNEVKLVPGTGIYYEDGSLAEIDYEGKDWWVVEGFVGEWFIDKVRTEYIKDASLKVNEDGSAILKVDQKEYSAKTSDVRIYNGSAYMIVDLDGYERGAEVILLKQESYDEIRFMCLPDPVPGYQFDPIDVYFNKK